MNAELFKSWFKAQSESAKLAIAAGVGFLLGVVLL